MRSFLLVGLLLATPAPTQQPPAQLLVADPTVGLPVFAGDVTDRRYVVIGVVTAGVRKPTIFSKASSQDHIYRELWERAERIGADAVIHARYGNSHVSAFSWGKTNASGIAIRFLPPETK